MRLEAKHFFSLAVVSISAEPISVLCGVNTRCPDGWSGAYSNITMCELWVPFDGRQIQVDLCSQG
ncbi:MAG: hypothetical protein FIO03_02510 [Nitrosopumilales archaeon]|nr:hypothetical protein [Nitrosopumilales archaeon]